LEGYPRLVVLPLMSGTGDRYIANSYTTNNNIELVRGGAYYFDLLESLINDARHCIHLQVYILDADSTGNRIASALRRAAERHVSVYVLADGYASQKLPAAFIQSLEIAGVRFRYFEPLLRSANFYFGRRLHQKVFVADYDKALVGGVNIADRYNDVDGIAAWLDFALYVKGDAAMNLHRICVSYWNKMNAADVVVPQLPRTINGNYSVRIRQNDWVRGRRQVWKSYFSLFHQAQESITIMCSYFLPGHILRKQLVKAVERGVKVKVILAGPSDVMVAKYAERYLYQWMLRNGIEVYEYQATVLHAKMAVADEHFVTIGSFNVNNISAYASVEMNLDVRNKSFGTSVQQLMNDIIQQDCIQVTAASFKSKATLFSKFLQRSAYDTIRLIINLSTFYFKPHH
jgi:cardiolipin synthase A/B